MQRREKLLGDGNLLFVPFLSVIKLTFKGLGTVLFPMNIPYFSEEGDVPLLVTLENELIAFSGTH
jgi:hypothetical protein